ncbi:MAG: FecCD family ABC transporter permease [Wenzhouxiangella sp.]
MITELGSTAAFFQARRRRHWVSLGFVLLVVVLGCAALASGSSGWLLLDAWNGDANARFVITEMRLPRAMAAALAGLLLGAAGAAMQSALRNPLASPSTIGVSQGAAFGAAVSIMFLQGGSDQAVPAIVARLDGSSLTVLLAFAGALASVLSIMLLATVRHLSPLAVILAGVALSAFFSAATMLLQYMADDTQVAASVFWTFGDVGRAGWAEVRIIAFVGIPSLAVILGLGRLLNALQWGDHTAQGLGINARAVRLLVMVAGAIASAAPTAFIGIIAFVGLMAPHIARIFVGDDQNHGLFLSALIGAAILLLADIIARMVLAPVVLPVGIITAFAGVPVLLYLLVRRT